MRYIVKITFHRFVNNIFTGNVREFNEPVKTLHEALKYRDMIDETVKQASIFDTVTNKTINWKTP